jgi:acyl-CoA synthetase (AMP-forming)/AMP-acid ligase II
MLDGIDRAQARRAADVTIGHMLRARAELHPHRIAIVDADRQFDFASLNERVNRLADVLHGMALTRGDRVAILSENRAEYLELMFAAGKLGIIVCALNWRLADGELRHCVRLAEPGAIFVSPGFAAVAARLDVVSGPTSSLAMTMSSGSGAPATANRKSSPKPRMGTSYSTPAGRPAIPKVP